MGRIGPGIESKPARRADRRLRVAVLLAVVLSLPTACGVEKFGSAAYYDNHSRPDFKVVLPPGAPYISQQFLGSSEPGAGGHNGIDIWGALQSPVIAAAPGRVAESFYEPAYGNRVVLDHGRDATGAHFWTVYKHLKQRRVEKGAVVARGDRIGDMGATGALGMMVHLHFEVLRGDNWRTATPLDPHLFWAQGVGRVTCYESRFGKGPAKSADPFRTTYPVICRGG